MIAVFTGSGLIGKEFDRRTIYVALCHPISRAQFILGKFLGLSMVLFLNWALLASAYLAILGMTEGGLEMFSRILFAGLFLVWIQSLMIASLAILFSTFTTTSLSVVFTIGFYLIGNTISQLRQVVGHMPASLGRSLAEAITTVLPNLEYFNFGLKVTYGLPVAGSLIAFSVLYGLVMVALILIFAGLLIQSREV
jgi:ABC-type transport system involved in multi-copper enzyme maturation permease subunit